MNLTVIILTLILAHSINAEIINVPDDFETIQGAIDEAEERDTILIAPGLYFENIAIDRHRIVIGSLFLTTNDEAYVDSTIIDGNEDGSVVTINIERDERTTIVGITIINGRANNGGGINCEDCGQVTVMKCVITNNYATNAGGGVYSVETHLNSFQSRITNNSSRFGGGIYGGGGDNGFSIGTTLIADNVARADGTGGMYCLPRSDVEMSNCTISNNSSAAPRQSGGGIHLSEESSMVINDMIFWGNSFPQLVFDTDNSDDIHITYCCIEGGKDSLDWEDDEDWDWQWEHNIMANPLFVNPDEGDYHLQAESPCIDTGMPMGLDPDGTTPDMGLFYFHQRDIAVDPPALDFNDVQIGTIDSLSITIQNTGLTILTINSQMIDPIRSSFEIGVGGGEIEIEPEGEHITWIRFSSEDEGSYQATLLIQSDDPDEELVEVVLVGNALGIKNQEDLPKGFTITEIYPNPFNSSTNINYSIPNSQRIRIELYNTSGKLVETLLDGFQTVGHHSAVWDSRDFGSGIYLLQVRTIGETKTAKLVVVK